MTTAGQAITGRSCVIFNPAGGRGRTQRLIERVRRHREVADDFRATQWPGHAEELACTAAQEGFARVVAVGGDGTAHEVANGVLRAGRSEVIFGVWPAGSANDYAYSLGCEPKPRRVDVGQVVSGGRSRWFINGLGLGFNAAVTVESRSIRRLRGVALYGWAFLRALARHYAAPPMELVLDDRTIRCPTLALTVNLGQREGNFLVTPRASLEDGLFDYLHVEAMSRWKMVRYLPNLATGRIPADDPLIHTGRVRSVTVRSTQPLGVHVDGEFFCLPQERITDLKITLHPARLLAQALQG